MKSDTFTLTGTWRTISALSYCQKITVGEDESVASYPTVEFNHRKRAEDDAIRHLAGRVYTFERESGYRPGDRAGEIQTVSGSSTFFQDED